MSIRFLLDMNILVFILRGRGEGIIDRLENENGRMAVSTVTVAELMYGAEKSASPTTNRRAVDEVLSLLEVQPFGTDAAVHTGEIRAGLERSGTSIGACDLMIAAQARAGGQVVVTNKVREFDRVPGLLVEDWTTARPGAGKI